MSPPEVGPAPVADLATAVMARRRGWESSHPSEAERQALARLSPSKADTDDEADAKADAGSEWMLLRSGAEDGHPSYDPDRLLGLVVRSYELAAVHDDERDLFEGLKAFNAELRAAAGLLFEFFLDRSGMDRASYRQLRATGAPDDPSAGGDEFVGASKMEWVLGHLSADLLWDAVLADEMPRPRNAYGSDGKARVFEHRLAGFLQRICGRPSPRFVLAISRALYPEAMPVMDVALYKSRSHEKASRLARDRRLADRLDEDAASGWSDTDPDVTDHSWYGIPPDTRQGEREVRKHGDRRRLIERISTELRRAELEAREFERPRRSEREPAGAPKPAPAAVGSTPGRRTPRPRDARPPRA